MGQGFVVSPVERARFSSRRPADDLNHPSNPCLSPADTLRVPLSLSHPFRNIVTVTAAAEL